MDKCISRNIYEHKGTFPSEEPGIYLHNEIWFASEWIEMFTIYHIIKLNSQISLWSNKDLESLDPTTHYLINSQPWKT